MPGRDSDAELRAEFDEIALVHLDRLHGSALYLTRDADRAADLVQETYLRAFRFFGQFQRGTNCLAWLHTILQNTFRNRYRSGQRERTHINIDDPQTAADVSAQAVNDHDPAFIVGWNGLDREVIDALASLPEEFRSAIVMVDLQDLNYEEAAKALDCPIGTVRSRLSRGRKALESRLRVYAQRSGILKRS